MSQSESNSEDTVMWNVLSVIGKESLLFVENPNGGFSPLIPMYSAAECFIGVSPTPGGSDLKAVLMHGTFQDPLISMIGLYPDLCVDYAMRWGADDLFTADEVEARS